MAEKKTFVLRVDSEMFKALEKWADDEFRSVNGQIEWILSQQLKQAGRIKPVQPAKADDKTQKKKDVK